MRPSFTFEDPAIISTGLHHQRVDGRTKARMKEAKQTPPDQPTAKAADVVAAFARDAAKQPPSPIQVAPASSAPELDASLEAFFTKRSDGKTDASNSNA
jgi:hypothetical protein